MFEVHAGSPLIGCFFVILSNCNFFFSKEFYRGPVMVISGTVLHCAICRVGGVFQDHAGNPLIGCFFVILINCNFYFGQ